MLGKLKKSLYRALARLLRHILDESHAWHLVEKKLDGLKYGQKRLASKQERIISCHASLAVILNTVESRLAGLKDGQNRIESVQERLVSCHASLMERLERLEARPDRETLPAVPDAPPFGCFVNRSNSEPENRDLELHYPNDRTFLSGILNQLFGPERDQLSPEERCIRILRFLASHIELGAIPCLTAPSEIIQGQRSSCGGFAEVFADMSRILGVPARYLGLFGLPGAASHALVESYYDGQWHLFDPTFGVFFYSREMHDSTGHVLSANEILIAEDPPFMMKVVERPWQKDYPTMAGYGVRRVEEQPAFHVLSYWGEQCRRVAFPVAYGNSSIVSFPVDVDLRNEEEFTIGSRDEDWTDIYKQYYLNPRVGYFYLGGDCPASFHTLQIKAPSHSKIAIRYFCTEPKGLNLELFPLDSVHLISHNNDADSVTFEILLTRESGSAMVAAPRLFWIDAVTFRVKPRNEAPRA